MLSWIFLDLGGPVIDDEPWSAHVRTVIREILAAEGLAAPPATFAAVERIVKVKRQSGFLRTLVHTVSQSEGQSKRVWAQVQAVLDATDLATFRRLSPLQSGAAEAIHFLARHYHLATLSNNLLIANDLLRDYGLWDCFTISGNSAEVGFSKPDPRLFRSVLDRAGCQPAEVLMVGDRLDNDIAPAKRLGLKTARIRTGWYRDVEPCSHEEWPDYEASSLLELARTLAWKEGDLPGRP
jgi:HAD superfamily hydrolase (TIGR01549 family)